MNIVLGVGGGIAAYKSCHVVRALREDGHTVTVVPTAAALRFVGAATWEALSGRPVQTSVFERVDEVEHIRIAQRAELVLIAPATADLIARLRAGMADDLLSATVVSTTAPVVIAPAMHTEMWQNPATVENIAVLRSRGVHIIEPASGRLTGADSGPGRLPEPSEIVAAALAAAEAPGNARAEAAAEAPVGSAAEAPVGSATEGPATGGPLVGRHVVITAGGTREPLDPVRFLGNRSSGKQGIGLARAARAAGATVTLIAANIDAALLAALDPDVTVSAVETTAQLQSAVRGLQPEADVIIMCAAVADYRPAETAAHKMKKSGDAGMTIELVQNPDILAGLVAERHGDQLIVGFAAETGSPEAGPEELARRKLLRKGCDLLVLNDVSEGRVFGRDDSSLIVYAREGEEAVEVLRASGTKESVSAEVVAAVAVRANR